MLAAAVGGILTATLGAPAALAFNALTFLAVAALLGSAPLPHNAGDDGQQDHATARDALRAAVAYVRDQRPLGLMLGAYAAFTVFAMAITPVEVVLVRGTLHAGSAALGVVLGAWGVGMIVGGALVGRIQRRVGLAALLIGAAVAEAVAFLGMGLSAGVAEVVAFAALGGAGNGLEGVLFMTAVQERVSDAFQARVSGLMEALMTAAVGVGFLAGGTVASLAGARATYLTAGLGGLAVVAWTLVRLRAHTNHGPATTLAPAALSRDSAGILEPTSKPLRPRVDAGTQVREAVAYRDRDGADFVARTTPPAVSEQPLPEPERADGARKPSQRRALPTPWGDSMQLADRIIVGGIAISGLYGLVLLPLFPLLSASHPALLELVRGSTASIVNMGARAAVGQTSFALAVLLGVPSVMMFDWLFWWAGRRWGDRVFVWLLGRDDARARRRLARLHTLERRVGPWRSCSRRCSPSPRRSSTRRSATAACAWRPSSRSTWQAPCCGPACWPRSATSSGSARWTSPTPSRTTPCGPRSLSSPR